MLCAQLPFRELGPDWWTGLGRLTAECEAAALDVYRGAIAPTMPHVLVVDDESLVRMTYERIIRRRVVGEPTVISIGNSYEAIKLARDFPVDLIITDKNRPELGGAETLSRIRSEGASKRCLVSSTSNL